MAGEDLMSWSTTNTSNANADSGISWVDGMPRATVKLSGRSIMAALAKQRNLWNGTITTAGSANAYTVTSPIGYTGSVPTGLMIRVKLNFTNTGAATLNLDSIGAVAIKTQLGNDPVAGELLVNVITDFIYNGTNWIIVGYALPA